MLPQVFRKIGASLADLLWPRRCAGCDAGLLLPGAADPLFCPDCRLTVSPIDPRSSCPRCAAPVVIFEPSSLRAPACLDCRRLPALLGRLSAPYEYGGALADALLRLKWRGRDDLAAPLGALLAPALLGRAGRCDVVVPVPLHRRRLRQRGYNQAALLARAALRTAGLRGVLPLRPGLLLRTRADPPARGLGPEGRFLRTVGAFAVPPRARLAVMGQRVLLVDDVVTTGATALGCATALRSAGARSVEVLALLRAAP